MSRELVARNGLSVSGKTFISTVDLNNNINQVVVIDGSELKYREVSSLPDTFVTGGTYNDTNGTATFTNNTGGTFNVTGFFTSANTINIYNTDASFTSERFANLDGNTLHLTGGSVNVDYIDFTPFESTGVTSSEGRVYFDLDYETLVIYNAYSDTSLQVGQENWFRVKNQSGQQIDNGVVVMASGTTGNSGRILIASAITDGTFPADYVMGVATHDITNGGDGWVTAFGEVRDIDTRGQNGETWLDGDILYSDPTRPGGLTNVQPAAPAIKTKVAIVLKATANGSIFVRPDFTPNLSEINDVDTSTANVGQVLTYSGSGIYNFQDTNNIYNNDGTLQSERVVDQDGNHLTFSGDSGVSIGTGTTSPVCAILELASTNQGLLIPRMTQAQRLSIPSPLPGLLVYCTDSSAEDLEGLYMYKSLGWVNIL